MIGRRALAALAAAAILASLSGCYRVVVRDSSREVGQPPVMHEHLWHHGFVFGIAELPSAGYRLDQLCPQGWSEIYVYTSGLNAIVGSALAAFTIYTPQTVSIRCAAEVAGDGSGEAAPPPGAEPR